MQTKSKHKNESNAKIYDELKSFLIIILSDTAN
jgi:hypothetical protein